MANTTTDLARPVHWQSAFWGLAAIGFNTAIQDSGSVLGLSKDHRMALRTSPFICLFDTVQVLLAFAVHCSHHPPREAIRLVAKGRLVEEAASEKSNPGQCMLTWASRVIALLQVVKIFSLSGLPWTQVFATFFFASYVIQEIINRFGETKKEHTPASSSQLENGHMQAKITASTPDPVAAPARDTLRLVVKKSAFAFQILLWMWLLGGPFHRDDRSAYGIFSHTIPLITAVAPAIPLWTSMACLCVGALVLALLADVFCTVVAWAAATYFLSGLADHPTQWWRRYLLNSISILIAIAVAIAQSKLFGFLFMTSTWTDYVPEAMDSATTAVLDTITLRLPFWYQVNLGGWMLALTVGMTYVVFTVGISLGPTHQSWFHKSAWVASFCVVMNIATPMLYYSTRYREDGTYKPAWSDNLG